MPVIRLAVTTLGCCGLLLSSGVLQAQTPAATDSATEAIRVFLDCNTFCDTEFIKREITYVNWVRDRADADVHLIITSQSTGGGGQEFTLRYLGLRGFRGADDELKFSTRQSDTDDEVRRQQTKRIGLGLVRYVAKGAFADRLSLTFSAPDSQAGRAQKPHDPWNLWVFRLSMNGGLNGESQNKFSRISGSFRADRVSEAWKFRLSASANRNNSSYTLSDSTIYKTHTSRYNGNVLLVRSLSDHWSLGVEATALRSTRDNYKLDLGLTPGLEFDVFPYKESSRRQLVLIYQVGIQHSKYRDTTIYDRIQETRPKQSFTIAAEATQPWGSLYMQLGAASLLNDFSKNRFSIDSYCSVRIVRGLNFNINGGYSRVRDQLSLVKEGVTDQDILLQLKQLKTAYYYYLSAGISYTFGSKFNNVVNPRFTHTGGGGGNCECFGGSCFCN